MIRTRPDRLDSPAGRGDARRRGMRACLLLPLLLPLLAVAAPLLPLRWGAESWSAADATAAGSEPPPLVREHLERALSEGNDERGSLPTLWPGGIRRATGSRLWFGERSGRKEGNVRAVCDEATGELLLFCRERQARIANDDDGFLVRDADDAKALAYRSLRRLCKTDPASWHLTVQPPRSVPHRAGYQAWQVQGARGGRYFEMHLDPSTGVLLFYTESDLPPKDPGRSATATLL